MKVALALELLKAISAAVDLLAKTREVYNKFKEQAQRNGELTLEDSARLDEEERLIDSSLANLPSGR